MKNPPKRIKYRGETFQKVANRDPQDLAMELEEIQADIMEKLDEVKHLLMDAPSNIRERATGYWLAHIRGALSDDSDYLGGSMVTMQDTINELYEEEEE